VPNPVLQHLRLQNVLSTPPSLSTLTKLTSLQLQFSEQPLWLQELNVLAPLTNIVDLRVGGRYLFGNQAAFILQAFPSLETLVAHSLHLDGELLAHLNRLTRLRVLSVAAIDVLEVAVSDQPQYGEEVMLQAWQPSHCDTSQESYSLLSMSLLAYAPISELYVPIAPWTTQWLAGLAHLSNTLTCLQLPIPNNLDPWIDNIDLYQLPALTMGRLRRLSIPVGVYYLDWPYVGAHLTSLEHLCLFAAPVCTRYRYEALMGVLHPAGDFITGTFSTTLRELLVVSLQHSLQPGFFHGLRLLHNLEKLVVVDCYFSSCVDDAHIAALTLLTQLSELELSPMHPANGVYADDRLVYGYENLRGLNPPPPRLQSLTAWCRDEADWEKVRRYSPSTARLSGVRVTLGPSVSPNAGMFDRRYAQACAHGGPVV
jgi:hypothetical protein